MSSSFLLDPYIINLIDKGSTLLDVACGSGKWGHLIQGSHKVSSFMLGVDVWSPQLVLVAKKQIYGDVVLCDVRFLPLRDSCFDTVLACEVIEHLDKADGEFLLSELERVSRDKIIVSTPNIVFDQDVVEGNPFQVHKSRWSTRDFRRNGFSVRGIGFGLFGRNTPSFMVMGFSVLSYFFPQISYLLLAVKKVV